MEFFSIINAVPGVPSGEEIINLLFPNIWVFLTHIIAAIILIIIVIFLLWKPTKKYIQKKKNFVQKEINEIDQKKKEADINFEISKKEILDTKNLANGIIYNATLEAEQIKKKSEKEAVLIYENIKKEAEISIKKRESDANANIMNNVSDIVFETTSALLSKKIDKNENQKLVDDIINNFNKQKGQE